MKNYKGSGDNLTLTAPSGGVTAGQVVLLGGILTIAIGTAAEGELFAGQRTGEITYEKANVAVAAGERAFFDRVNNRFTNASATGLFPAGTFTDDADAGDATTSIVLDGIHTEAVA